MKDTTASITPQALAQFVVSEADIKAILYDHGCRRTREDENGEGGFSHRVLRTVLAARLRGTPLPEGLLISDHKGILQLDARDWRDVAPSTVFALLGEWGHYDGNDAVILANEVPSGSAEILAALHALQRGEAV